MAEPKVDQRREAGLRTRTRLMDACLDLIAERGEASVTLREVTNTAGANVAAVSYHFGSLNALVQAAIELALERYLDSQQAALDPLEPGASVEQLATAFAQPMIGALAEGGQQLALIRIVARAAIEPPESWDRLDPRFEHLQRDVTRILKTHLPDVADAELRFRARCAAGLLNWLVLAPVGRDLHGRTRPQIQLRVVPPLIGVFRGAG